MKTTISRVAIVVFLIFPLILLFIWAILGTRRENSKASEVCGVHRVLGKTNRREWLPWRPGELRVVCMTDDPKVGRVVEVEY